MIVSAKCKDMSTKYVYDTIYIIYYTSIGKRDQTHKSDGELGRGGWLHDVFTLLWTKEEDAGCDSLSFLGTSEPCGTLGKLSPVGLCDLSTEASEGLGGFSPCFMSLLLLFFCKGQAQITSQVTTRYLGNPTRIENIILYIALNVMLQPYNATI